MISEYRQNLIKLVLDFVISCKEIDGVDRISIIGSLIYSKVKPKDVDLLITISDALDLTHLAKISRRLQGKSGELTGGADIFLANRNNEYLGRICIWKDCRPGVRMSCDAQNCGMRKYLHDDLGVIKIAKEVVEKPSLILYPNLVRNTLVPEDVEEELIKKIYQDAI
ncbi:MAG: hypothetical protein ACYC5G_05860 [Candidatus Doudnabacteria bacterium]